MLTRPLGPNLPAVTIVGYGGMHLSLDSRPSEDVGVKVIHAALDAGETLIDTADVYCLDQNDIGHNERLMPGRCANGAATGRTSWSRPKADW